MDQNFTCGGSFFLYGSVVLGVQSAKRVLNGRSPGRSDWSGEGSTFWSTLECAEMVCSSRSGRPPVQGPSGLAGT